MKDKKLYKSVKTSSNPTTYLICLVLLLSQRLRLLSTGLRSKCTVLSNITCLSSRWNECFEVLSFCETNFHVVIRQLVTIWLISSGKFSHCILCFSGPKRCTLSDMRYQTTSFLSVLCCLQAWQKKVTTLLSRSLFNLLLQH